MVSRADVLDRDRLSTVAAPAAMASLDPLGKEPGRSVAADVVLLP